jgi:hypothetical protein
MDKADQERADKNRDQGWSKQEQATLLYPGCNARNEYKQQGGGRGKLSEPRNVWIGSFKDLVEHDRHTQAAPLVIQNGLKIGLAEGLIVELEPDLYDFSGLQKIPNFGGFNRGWTTELNMGRMRWEYEDPWDLGANAFYPTLPGGKYSDR